MKQAERKVRVKAADYVWCKTDECLVPKSKLHEDSIFEDDPPVCPFCGGTDLEEAARSSSEDDGRTEVKADKSERQAKSDKSDKPDKDKLTFD
jgi:hypothetical protein